MRSIFAVAVTLLAFAVCMAGQSTEKPRVFIAGKGSVDVNTDGASGGNHWFRAAAARSTIDSHDESLEMAKDFGKECPDVTVTVNQANADYTVTLNRESKKNRGLLKTNNQVMIVNRAGDMLHAGATHAVSSATKDACSTIMSDWQAHGRVPVPTAAPATAPSAPVQTVEATTLRQSLPPAPSVQPVAQSFTAQQVAAQQPVMGQTISQPVQQESLGDAARRMRQQKPQSPNN